ncbi:tetratricopeptide repeat protein [Sphaerospermopsis aphanizomenoides BCCUSP55]|uniref:serine protease n=1 Tax=Sphaerospermopsis aphanizomenoides TaxID=459663 RepID=UPI0019047DBF|nr:serine protease [Sphaerospermopsis aphanizomenoides]MBK1987777.1 tetratricopeptide repeat protein [Sphaerospermopsis aphanizomenoides BCCUSP55]
MKLPKNLYKLSHLLLFLLLLFPASPIIITGCSSSLFARKPGTFSESELKNILKEITFKVIVDDKETASGTIIKKQNGFYTVLTNAHVIENAKSVKVVTPDNKTHDVEFSKLDRQDNKKDDLYDLAKLTFSSETTYLVAGLGEEDIKPGEKVFAGGYVKGNLQTTKGTAKLFLNQPLIKGQQIAYDNDIQQGMSGGAIINEKGYLVGINSKLANPVLQTDFRYLQGEQPDEKTLKEWGNYSWGIAVNLVDEAAPDLTLFPERVIRKVGGIPAKVLDIAKQSSVKIQGKSGIGSGVIIAKDKDVYYVLTAAHVVENKQEYQVVAPNKQVYKVDNETIRTRKGLDMAVLQFRSSQVYQVATLGDYELKEQYVFLYGWKGEELNHPSLFSVGKIQSAEKRDYWAKPRGYELAYSNEGYPGMSGGGIWDTEGRLIGIHNYSETDVLGFSLGLSIQTFLFYQKDNVWKLPQPQLNVAKNEPKSADAASVILAFFQITSEPNSVNATGIQWLNYGIQLWRTGDTDNAIKAMENAVIKDPNSWQSYYNVSWIWAGKGKYHSALAAINTAIIEKPSFYRSYLFKSVIFRNLKQYQNALEAINQGFLQSKENHKEDFLLYATRGEILSNLEKYDQAIADFTQVIKINFQFTRAYYNRGVIYYEQGKIDSAIQDFTQAIAINPQYAKAYYYRGTIYGNQGKIDSAIQDFTQAIIINPQYTQAYYDRGIAYSEQEKVDLAIADFTQVIKINPQYAEAYYNRGFIYGNQRKVDSAIQDFTQAIAINPQYAQAYHNRGNIYAQKGKLELAIADFTQVIKINPKFVDAYNNLGYTYIQQRKLDQALQNYKQAIAINPQNPKAYLGRGLAYGLQSNKQQAIKDLETAKQLFQQQGDKQGYQNAQEIINKL